ncbi:MAG: tRNA threonylcarbamoyladenosine dehydratase [Bacillota bacterium]|nr:tRNA threonylcarbamoyladenosine dehydratase [Bacillota bacterium]
METIYDRTAMLLGRQAVEILQKKAVIVFGIGGVGGFVAEALARTGVGRLGLVDADTVSVSNCNRQIVALHSTLGRPKAEVMEERIRDIDPHICVQAFPRRLSEETLASFRLEDWDHIADAIDDVPAKLLLIREAVRLGKPVVSAMGAGNRMDPTAFQVAEISKTHTCPLARAVRRELNREGLGHVKAVFSPEAPGRAETAGEDRTPASVIWGPASAGLLMASEIVKDLLAEM